jgi:hypothetical protein
MQFASSINFIRSDEVDGLDVDGSMSIDSFWGLIFVCEDVGGVVMASAKKLLEFSEFSEMKLYSDHHVIDVTIAYEASRASSRCPGALDNCLELRDPCTLTWVPMSRLPVSSGPGIPILWNLFVDAR